MSYVFYSLNIKAADDMATQGARATAAMLLTKFLRNILVSPEALAYWGRDKMAAIS